MRDENAIVVEAWNTVLFDKFVRFRHVLTHGLSGHSDEMWRRLPIAEGSRVLDVGCGFGDTTQWIAAATGPKGKVVGVDCAAKFIDMATKEARAAQLDWASFLV